MAAGGAELGVDVSVLVDHTDEDARRHDGRDYTGGRIAASRQTSEAWGSESCYNCRMTPPASVMTFGDHGFADVSTTYHLNDLLREEGLLDVSGSGAITRRRAWAAGNGGSAHVYVLDGAAPTTVDRLRERFAALPGVEALGPERFRDLGLPAPRWDSMQGDSSSLPATALLHRHPTKKRPRARPCTGRPRHFPSFAPLGAAFVMAGLGVRANVELGAISMLDLGPTAPRASSASTSRVPRVSPSSRRSPTAPRT